jgi:hypothetical protein
MSAQYVPDHMSYPSRPMTITCANCQRRVDSDLARAHWAYVDDGTDTVGAPHHEARIVELSCSDRCWEELAAPHLTGIVFELV